MLPAHNPQNWKITGRKLSQVIDHLFYKLLTSSFLMKLFFARVKQGAKFASRVTKYIGCFLNNCPRLTIWHGYEAKLARRYTFEKYLLKGSLKS